MNVISIVMKSLVKMPRIVSLAVLVCFLGMVGCESEYTCDNGVQDGNETGTDCGGDCPACVTYNPFTLVVNGVTISEPQVLASLDTSYEAILDTNPVILGSTLGLNYIFNNNTEIVTVAFSNGERTGQCLATGPYTTLADSAYWNTPMNFGNVSYLNTATGAFYISNYISQFGEEQFINLVNCVGASKKIYGNFNVALVNSNNLTDSITMSVSGAFNNLSYTVQ